MKTVETNLKGFPSSVPGLQDMPPGLSGLVREYIELSTQPELSDADSKRLIEISALAEYDDELDNWFARIDDNIDLILISQQWQKKPYSLEDFIREVNQLSPETATLEEFWNLVKKVEIDTKTIEQHTLFKYSDYTRQLICQSKSCSVYVISWKPGQKCQPHTHTDSMSILSILKVIKGELTHWFCENTTTTYNNLPGYRRHKMQRFQEGDWVKVNYGDAHELSNESQEELITLHFRFFSSSSEEPTEDTMHLEERSHPHQPQPSSEMVSKSTIQ